MREANVPIVPGATDAVADASAAREAAKRFGLPLALKAAAGGGGKGLKVAHSLDEIDSAYSTARREAEAYFKDGTIYAERYLENPKHVELQVLADKHGHVVHVGERDCSMQRRHQKLWEETPAQIPDRVRAAMREAGIRAAKAIGYDSAGTIECLVSGDEFYLEMNTSNPSRAHRERDDLGSRPDSRADSRRRRRAARIRAERHSLQWGCDRSARERRGSGARLPPRTRNDRRLPRAGRSRSTCRLGGLSRMEIPPEYDSLVAKLIVWAPARDGAIARLRRAIDEYVIEGVPTTLPLLRSLCDLPTVARNLRHRDA